MGGCVLLNDKFLLKEYVPVYVIKGLNDETISTSVCMKNLSLYFYWCVL